MKTKTPIAAGPTPCRTEFPDFKQPLMALSLVVLPGLAVAANSPPVAVSGTLTTWEDASKAITLNASDANQNPLTFSVDAASAHGGTVTLQGRRAIYTPATNWRGTDSFSFRANDGQADSNSAVITVTVKPLNDPPTASPTSAVTGPGAPVLIPLSGADVDGDPVSFAVKTPPAHGQAQILGGTATYTPQAGYTGPDSFSFTAYDGKLRSHPATVGLDVQASACSAWTNPATWGGAVPAPGADLTIAAGQCVTLAGSPPEMGGLTIQGRLEFAEADIELRAKWILLDQGELHIGSAEQPFQHHATLTLTDTDAAANLGGMGTRGLLVMNGVLELHGVAPSVIWTKINQHAPANATQLSLEQAVDWQVGDEIIVGPTDFYSRSETELHQVAGLAGQTLNLQNPLTASRWGLLQYATPTGLSLSDATLATPPADPASGSTPLVLDERAEVANLTRHIVIQAPDDTLWQTAGFGAHLMIMGQDSHAHIDGVEFRRVGQRGILGRYPYHSHRRSYVAGGAAVGDVTGDYLRNSSLHQSTNRCITIHATNGLTVQNNVCYDIQGHGVFFEDAVERRNLVEGNLIMHVRNPPLPPEQALKLHELADYPGLRSGSSGLWVSNPDNTVRNNVAADAQGFGLWMAFPQHPVGASADVALIPRFMRFGNFDDNTTHSNANEGTMFDESETDDLGNLQMLQYFSTTADGLANFNWPIDPNLHRFSFKGLKTWKNGVSGLWNRVTYADYSEFVSADNHGRYFAGAGAGGVITRSLVVGTSLNNPTERPFRDWYGAEVAFASYHSGFDIHHNIAMHFPLNTAYPNVGGGRSGVFDTSDYYLRPVEKGQIRNVNNLIIDSHPGFRAVAEFPHYKLAGALWDPQGVWGPANNWSVYDLPFFTHNAQCQPGSAAGGASCDGDYYGAQFFVVNRQGEPYDAQMEIDVNRYGEAAPHPLVDTWHINSGVGQSPFPNMRHFAARDGGLFLLDFPGYVSPEVVNVRDVSFQVENMLTQDSTVVVGVRFSGALPVRVAATTYNPNGLTNVDCVPSTVYCRSYQAVESLAAVIASPGETFWQDTENQVVWMKLRGGLEDSYVAPEDLLPFSEATMYEAINLRIQQIPAHVPPAN
ncbi:Ig-like domain-containing protein [Methylomagnum sp.]